MAAAAAAKTPSSTDKISPGVAGSRRARTLLLLGKKLLLLKSPLLLPAAGAAGAAGSVASVMSHVPVQTGYGTQTGYGAVQPAKYQTLELQPLKVQVQKVHVQPVHVQKGYGQQQVDHYVPAEVYVKKSQISQYPPVQSSYPPVETSYTPVETSYTPVESYNPVDLGGYAELPVQSGYQEPVHVGYGEQEPQYATVQVQQTSVGYAPDFSAAGYGVTSALTNVGSAESYSL